jgi:hypothetical protein
MRLAEIQDTMSSVAAGEREPTPELLELLSASPRSSPLRRLQVYADTVRLKTAEGLAVPFPKLEALLGREQFLRLADAYRWSCPRERRTLENLVRELPEFLERRAVQGGRPDLADLAALDLARFDVATGARADPATAEALRDVSVDEWTASLAFIPAMRLLRLRFDVATLWKRLDDEEEPPPPHRTPTPMLVWRLRLGVYHSVLEAAEAEAIARALDGATLPRICAAFAGEKEPDEAAYAALHQWFADGLVASVRRARRRARPSSEERA